MWTSRYVARSSGASAFYPVLVHRRARLLDASFRPRLATVALASSLGLHLHPVGQRTFTSKLLSMPSTQRTRYAGDASRATIWQGNCHVEDQLFYSNSTRAQNTIPIQYPLSNCPAKPTGSFKRLYRKRAKAPCSRTFLRGCASDKALTFFVPNPRSRLYPEPFTPQCPESSCAIGAKILPRRMCGQSLISPGLPAFDGCTIRSGRNWAFGTTEDELEDESCRNK